MICCIEFNKIYEMVVFFDKCAILTDEKPPLVCEQPF